MFQPTMIVVFKDQSSNEKHRGEFRVMFSFQQGSHELVRLEGYRHPVNAVMLEETPASIQLRADRVLAIALADAHAEKISRAFYAGIQAKEERYKPGTNPHEPGSELWNAWHRGYKDEERRQVRSYAEANKRGPSAQKGEAKRARADEDRRRANRK